MALEQHNPPHVGGIIYRTYIEPFDDVYANKIADALGVASSTFSRLLNGVSNLSPEMSIRLSIVLGGSAESWLIIQENYDRWNARKKSNAEHLTKMKFKAVA